MTVLSAPRLRTIYCRAGRAPDRRRSEPAPGRLLVGDAVTQLRTLPATSVDCVITSPPYFMLRNYGHDDQIGLEASVHGWVGQLLSVMEEVARVLKPTGGVWLNLGDSFSRAHRYGAPPKSLLLGPERLLLALSDAGWIVRNKVIWAKPNPMPASVRDRLTCAWEPMYFLVRSPDYFFDLDVAREPHRSRKPRGGHVREGKYESAHPTWAGPLAGKNDGLLKARRNGMPGHPLGKNPGDVWQLSTATFNGAHFAVYPERLIERPLKLSCPERVCDDCGRPWRRDGRRDRVGDLHRDCDCEASWRPGVVLDPFMGSGTTAVVAERMSRRWVGIELNPDYAELASQRVAKASDQLPERQPESAAKTRPAEAAQQHARRPRVVRKAELRMPLSDQTKAQGEPDRPDGDHGNHADTTDPKHDLHRFQDFVGVLDRREHGAREASQQDRSDTREDGLEPVAEIVQLTAQPPGLDLEAGHIGQLSKPGGAGIQQEAGGDQSDRHHAANRDRRVHGTTLPRTPDIERNNLNGGPNA